MAGSSSWLPAKPARRRRNLLVQLAKALVGRQGAILGQITAGQDQVDLRLLVEHPFNHSLQAVVGIHAQQFAVCSGKQMTVGQLHQQDRRVRSKISNHRRRAWQGRLLERNGLDYGGSDGAG